MSTLAWTAAALAGLSLMVLGQWLWRRRRAAKLADQLLEEVVKGKDAFRR